MKGFLLVDKKKGETSFDVIRQLRRLTGEKKIGHAGTLDPLATGLLLIAVGEGTKLLEYFVGCDKEYEVEAKFGWVSDTYDAEGVLTEGIVSMDFEETSLSKIIEQDFVGDIEQVPPIYSALKVKGKKAYELARKGEEVELKSRKVKIDRFEIVDFSWPQVKFKVACSSGTYVRSLIHDLGERIGCGAYVKNLRRTVLGNFVVQDAMILKESVDVESFLYSLESVVNGFDRVDLSETELAELDKSGVILGKKIEQDFIMAFYEDKLVAILENSDKGLKNRKRIW